MDGRRRVVTSGWNNKEDLHPSVILKSRPPPPPVRCNLKMIVFLRYRYGGCGGNGNNFKTSVNCQKNCGGSVEDPVLGEPSVIRQQRPEQTTPTSARGEAGANETTGLRKRKMKRVRILPKDQGSSTKARGSSRFSSQDLQERSLLFDPDETLNDDDKPENRDILSRTRLRSRTSSGSSDLASSSSGPSINIESIRQSFRRPSRTISNLTSISSLSRGEERAGGPRAEVGRVLHRARKVATKGDSRVDAVMKAPPNMKTGGLVVIKSYCRSESNNTTHYQLSWEL